MKTRLSWRATLRWSVFAGLPLVWACVDHKVVVPTPEPSMSTFATYRGAINRKLDIIFAIDDSASMAPLITNMLANFPTFMGVLQNLDGGLPDLHLAVVSQNLGAAQTTDILGCPLDGDHGAFLTTPHPVPGQATCPVPNGHFITASADGTANNFMGSISDVFTCIANLGDTGCGFEHQLESVRRALGGSPGVGAPATNTGFLRADAYLAVIWLTNEDDCSAPRNSPLFDESDESITSMYGPLQSYRCNEWGHTCNGKQPPRTVAEDNLSCVDAGTDPWQRLFPVSDYITFFKSLKADPSLFLPAAIAAPPTPYSVHLYQNADQMTGAPELWPYVVHSCGMGAPGQETGIYGDPAVRINQLLDAFGQNAVFENICSTDYGPALTQIANVIGRHFGPQCIPGKLVDADLTMAGVQPDCSVVDISYDAQNNQVQAPLPSCDVNGDKPPCWQLAVDAVNCPNGMKISINRGTATPTSMSSNVECSVCPPGSKDPGCTY